MVKPINSASSSSNQQPSSAPKFERFKCTVLPVPIQPKDFRAPRESEKAGFEADITSLFSPDKEGESIPRFKMLFNNSPQGKEIYTVRETMRITGNTFPPCFSEGERFQISVHQIKDPSPISFYVKMAEQIDVPDPKALGVSRIAKTSSQSASKLDRFTCKVDAMWRKAPGFAHLGWTANIEGPPLPRDKSSIHREFSKITIEVPKRPPDAQNSDYDIVRQTLGDIRSFGIEETTNGETKSGKPGYIVWPVYEETHLVKPPCLFFVTELSRTDGDPEIGSTSKIMDINFGSVNEFENWDNLPASEMEIWKFVREVKKHLDELAQHRPQPTPKSTQGSLVDLYPQPVRLQPQTKKPVEQSIPLPEEVPGLFHLSAMSSSLEELPTSTALKTSAGKKPRPEKSKPAASPVKPSHAKEPRPSGWSLLDLPTHNEKDLTTASEHVLALFKEWVEKGCHHKEVAHYIGATDHMKIASLGEWDQYKIRLDGSQRMSFLVNKTAKQLWICDIGGHT